MNIHEFLNSSVPGTISSNWEIPHLTAPSLCTPSPDGFHFCLSWFHWPCCVPIPTVDHLLVLIVLPKRLSSRNPRRRLPHSPGCLSMGHRSPKRWNQNCRNSLPKFQSKTDVCPKFWGKFRPNKLMFRVQKITNRQFCSLLDVEEESQCSSCWNGWHLSRPLVFCFATPVYPPFPLGQQPPRCKHLPFFQSRDLNTSISTHI